MDTQTGKSYTLFVPNSFVDELLPVKKRLKLSWQNLMLQALSQYIKALKCNEGNPKSN